MTPLRVLIVEDSRTVREHLVEVLTADPGFQVVAAVGDGSAALKVCARERPDVISLDMVLPGISGLEVTREIMATQATPILIVSSSTNRGEAFDTLDALKAGAVEVFDKSRLGRDPAWVEALKTTLRLVARIPVVTRARPRGSSSPVPVEIDRTPLPSPAGVAPRLVALGASTGGPAAMARILAELPADYRLPTLVVMHMAPLFADALVQWLGRFTPLGVRMAVDGEPLPAPCAVPPVLLAPPDRHLILEQGRLRLTTEAERFSCRPSVDVLFESLAAELGSRTVAGLLTGMGRDGAAGLLALRHRGALTFAQDEATSVVFGMPREAIELGAAARVFPLGKIAVTLGELSRAAAEETN